MLLCCLFGIGGSILFYFDVAVALCCVLFLCCVVAVVFDVAVVLLSCFLFRCLFCCFVPYSFPYQSTRLVSLMLLLLLLLQ